MIRTNDKLDLVKADVQELLSWAEADAEQSRDDDALGQAHNDEKRAALLRKVLALLDGCYR